MKDWEKDDRVIIHDVKLYYAYLPAVIISNDFSFDYVYEDFIKHKNYVRFIRTPKGARTIITTFGMTIAYSPFFLIAHSLARHGI